MSWTKTLTGGAAMVRRSATAAVLSAFGIGLCGCVSIFPKSKPIQLYSFGQLPPPTALTAQRGEVGVVLAMIAMPPAAVGDQILTVTGQQAAYIAGARWVVSAGSVMQSDAERAFESQGRRVRLLHRGDLGAAAALLRLDVGDFEARYDAPDSAPTIVVSLRAALTRPGGALIAEQSFTVRQPAGENRIGAIARAYDRAVIDVLGRVVEWTEANTVNLGTQTAATAQTITSTSTSTNSTTIQTPR